jgi:AAA family ATP:ADP antiporter
VLLRGEQQIAARCYHRAAVAALGLIDIRPGEKRGLVVLSSILALITASHTLLETARDTLFLTKLPPQRLAYVYVLLAVVAIFASSLSGAASKRFGRRAGLVLSLGAAAFTMVWTSLREPTPAIVFFLYLASGVAGTVLTLQYWLLVGQFFTVAQGKRLFGPMAAGGVLGATLGAALAAVLLRFVAADRLLVVGAGLFLLAAAAVTRIPEAEGIDDADLSPTRPLAFLHDFRILRSHRYVALVAALSFTSVAAVLLADYLFKSAAAAELGPARLGPFLGTYYAVQNAVSLVVQVFLTGAIVRKLGVTTALLVFPLLLLVGGVGAFATGAFALALAVKGTDGALRHSLHRVTSELLLLPLSSDVRDRAKRLLETVFGRGSQAVAALAIVVLASLGLADTRTLAIAVAGLAAAWLMVALLLRTPYLDLFRRALARGELEGPEQELDLPAVGALLESLSSVEEPTVLAAIDLVDRDGRRKLLPALILYHESPIVLERALVVFAKEPRRDFVPLAERLLGVKDANVRASAVRALATVGRRSAAEVALFDDDPKVRATAAFFLANETSAPEEDPAIRAVLAEKTVAARCALLEVIADHGDPHWANVLRAIVRDPEVMGLEEGSAARAMQRTGSAEFGPVLLELLARRGARDAARAALIALGDASLPLGVRREIPLVLTTFATQEVVDLLMGLVDDPEVDLQRRVLRALGRVSTEARVSGARVVIDRSICEDHVERTLLAYLESLDVRVCIDDASLTTADPESLSLLRGLLADRSEALLERAFRFLQLANRNEDIRPVFDAVVRGDRRARATAMEFLDALTLSRPAIRELLRVVADDLDLPERVRRGRALRGLGVELPTPDDTLARLVREDETLVAALAYSCAASQGREVDRILGETRAMRPEVIALTLDAVDEEVARA